MDGSVSQAPPFVPWLFLTVTSLPEEDLELSEELIDRAHVRAVSWRLQRLWQGQDDTFRNHAQSSRS
jgi:hypothetical protein